MLIGVRQCHKRCVRAPYLLLGLTRLPLARFLLDMRRHGERGAIVTVGQVDDVCDRRKHRPLAAGADDGVAFTHRQQQLISK